MLASAIAGALRGLQEELDFDSLIRKLNLTGVRAI